MPATHPVIDEIPGLYRIIPLQPFRHTPGVAFDIIPGDLFPRIDAFDRVVHEFGAISPGPVAGVERPWYMHPHQDDNLLILHGTRYVEIYSKAHGRVESFEATPSLIKQQGKIVYEGAAMLVWPCQVFHRISSSATTGSASLNFAVHYDGFDIRTNFNIYDLDPATGEFRVIRAGHLDQT